MVYLSTHSVYKIPKWWSLKLQLGVIYALYQFLLHSSSSRRSLRDYGMTIYTAGEIYSWNWKVEKPAHCRVILTIPDDTAAFDDDGLLWNWNYAHTRCGPTHFHCCLVVRYSVQMELPCKKWLFRRFLLKRHENKLVFKIKFRSIRLSC